MLKEHKQELVNKLLQKGILVPPQLLNIINEDVLTLNNFDNLIQQSREINNEIKEEILEFLKEKNYEIMNTRDKLNINNNSINKYKNNIEGKKTTYNYEYQNKQENIKLKKDQNKNSYNSFSNNIKIPEIEIIFNYNEDQNKKGVKDFVSYFNNRFDILKNIIIKRPEFSSVITIRTLLRRKTRETVNVVGLVNNISETKNGNLIIEVEDPTGKLKAIVSKSKPQIFDLAKNIVLDEVIGLLGTFTGEVMFVTDLTYPDIPVLKEFPSSPEEEYALFLGDIHIGSKYFMKDQWNKLILWIKGEYGNEKQREISKKTKYLFFMGDNVDGVGIYPNQSKDLYQEDIFKQYEEFEDYVLSLPKNKRIVIIPGNHDASRISEPQPPIDKQYCPRLYEQDNINFLSSPSYVNISRKEGFSGIKVLLYHGYSFPYYAENVESVRTLGGLERVDKIMSFLLQKRHLAPSHKSTLYIPGKKDNLIINPIPDIFATGHVHRTTISSYKNIITINASSWLSETDYQKKVGLKPEPGRAVLVNLQTKHAKILNFNQ